VSDQGAAYSYFLVEELERESKRRESIDSRAMATVAGSGAIVALGGLILTFGQASAGKGNHSVGLATAATLAFLAAATVAIVAGLPRRYKAAEVAMLRAMTSRLGTDHEDRARRFCAKRRLESLETLRDGNNLKAWLLIVAQGCQAIGILLLVLATWRAHIVLHVILHVG